MIEGIENAYPNYGLPKQKKYPLPDRKHVLSAIRFFNYVSPKDEKQLAEAILEKIKEYGMKDVGVGPDNRFLKYYKKEAYQLEHHGVTTEIKGGELIMADFKITRSDELMHYRTKGSKNGVRLYQNPDGSLTPLGERHYRDMYGYGERDGGVSKTLATDLRRSRPGQIVRTLSTSGVQKPSVRGILKPPSTSREYNQEMLYNTLGNRLRNVGGKDRADTSSPPKNPSPEYLEELNYNSNKNEYPSGMQPVNTKQHEKSTRNESALEKAYNGASKWVVDRADDVKKGATDAARVISELPKNISDPHLKEGFDNSYNAVKELVTTAADDVKNMASEAFDAGKKWVEQAAKDVDKVVDSAVSDVMKAVDDAKNGVADAANAVGKAAQDGWNWVKGLFGGGDDYGKDEDKDRSNHSSSSYKM